jgi:electron transfer flavoprotein alpha/beta subunit
MGIAKAAKREIGLKNASDLALEASAVGTGGSQTEQRELLYPPVGEGAQLLEGTPAEASEKLAQVLKEKGFA